MFSAVKINVFLLLVVVYFYASASGTVQQDCQKIVNNCNECKNRCQSLQPSRNYDFLIDISVTIGILIKNCQTLWNGLGEVKTQDFLLVIIAIRAVLDACLSIFLSIRLFVSIAAIIDTFIKFCVTLKLQLDVMVKLLPVVDLSILVSVVATVKLLGSSLISKVFVSLPPILRNIIEIGKGIGIGINVDLTATLRLMVKVSAEVKVSVGYIGVIVGACFKGASAPPQFLEAVNTCSTVSTSLVTVITNLLSNSGNADQHAADFGKADALAVNLMVTIQKISKSKPKVSGTVFTCLSIYINSCSLFAKTGRDCSRQISGDGTMVAMNSSKCFNTLSVTLNLVLSISGVIGITLTNIFFGIFGVLGM